MDAVFVLLELWFRRLPPAAGEPVKNLLQHPARLHGPDGLDEHGFNGFFLEIGESRRIVASTTRQ